MASEFTVESCVRGYHVYQERWTAVIGEVLSCRREPGNASDPIAVAVMKEKKLLDTYHTSIHVFVTYYYVRVDHCRAL